MVITKQHLSYHVDPNSDVTEKHSSPSATLAALHQRQPVPMGSVTRWNAPFFGPRRTACWMQPTADLGARTLPRLQVGGAGGRSH